MSSSATAPRALVTGATGFVGMALVRALRAAGWRVDAIVRPGSDAVWTDQLTAAGCALHRHDGTVQHARDIVAAAEPSCTWHLAGLFVGDHAPDDVVPLVRANVEFGACLLEALSSQPAAPVVTVGTFWQNYDNAPYSPMSLYAATKQSFDAIAAYYAEVRQMRIVECLMTDTYGPGDPRKKLLWALKNAAVTGIPLAMAGEGRQFIDLLHVDDVVRALIVAGDRARAGAPGLVERWAVRSGDPITVKTLVDRFARVLGVPVHVQWGSRAPRPREMFVPWTAGTVLPDWSARIPLDTGLVDLR